MKKTLLKLVQDILSDMDSDEVNDINETVESRQVAVIAENTFWTLVSDNTIPEHKTTANLVGLGDTDTPTKMQIPSGMHSLEWIKYNKFTTTDTNTQFKNVTWMDPIEFLEMTWGRNVDDSNVDEITDGAIKFFVRNDSHPEFWTTFDDEYIVFDAYDNTVDTTLQQVKSLTYGIQVPTFTQSNTYIPDIDDHLHPVLYNMVKSQAFLDLKQTANPLAEVKGTRGMSKAQRKKKRAGGEKVQRPDYGRTR